MNEKELRDALLSWAAQSGPSAAPDQTLARVLSRDRRRVRLLATATAVLWLLAAGGIPMFFALYMNFIFPKVEAVLHEMITHDRHTDPAALDRAAHITLLATSKLGILLVTASVLALLLAACGTLLLVFASRRATLRQVNANLTQIATHLRPPSSGPAAPPPPKSPS